MSDWIYRQDGELFTPGKWTGGPWSTELQHGGPVAALFARSAEQLASESGLQLVRLTTELFRPVPMEPLELASREVRRGHRIAALDVELRRPGQAGALSRGTALLLRADPEAATSFPAAEQRPPEPGEGDETPFIPEKMARQRPPGFHSSIRSCFGRDEHGPYAWIRTDLDLVAGSASTPLQHFSALADICFGLSGRLRTDPERDLRSATMINTDSTVYWQRMPRGDWMGLRPQLLADHAGIAVADVELYDVHGRVGRCVQAAMHNPRPRHLGPRAGPPEPA